MNEPKHSSGPWKAVFPKEPNGEGVIFAFGIPVATVCNYDGTAYYGFKDIANAQLMAAAPELLNACREVLFAWESGDDAGRDLIAPMDSLRIAIAKATGEAE